jgi:hypothetical protein
MIKNFYLLSYLEQNLKWLKSIPLLPILFDESLKISTFIFRPAVFYQMMVLCDKIAKLPNIQRKYHQFGGLEFRVNDTEFAHLHSNGLLDILLNKEVKNKFLNESSVKNHHVFENSNWVSIYLNAESDIDKILQIVLEAYNLKV